MKTQEDEIRAEIRGVEERRDRALAEIQNLAARVEMGDDPDGGVTQRLGDMNTAVSKADDRATGGEARPPSGACLLRGRRAPMSSRNVADARSSMPARSYTDLCVFTRMSLMVGSRSSGSSGPRPKTSSRTSPNSASRSDMLRGVDSSASRPASNVRISLSALNQSACASASRFRRPSSFRWTFALSSRPAATGRRTAVV